MSTVLDDDFVDTRRYDVAAIIAEFGTATTADAMGVSRRTVQRWVTTGVDFWTADKIAVKVVGDHPGRVWGRDWC